MQTTTWLRRKLKQGFRFFQDGCATNPQLSYLDSQFLGDTRNQHQKFDNTVLSVPLAHSWISTALAASSLWSQQDTHPVEITSTGIVPLTHSWCSPHSLLLHSLLFGFHLKPILTLLYLFAKRHLRATKVAKVHRNGKHGKVWTSTMVSLFPETKLQEHRREQTQLSGHLHQNLFLAALTGWCKKHFLKPSVLLIVEVTDRASPAAWEAFKPSAVKTMPAGSRECG